MEFSERLSATLEALTTTQGILGEENLDVGQIGGVLMSASELLSEVESVLTSNANDLEKVYARNKELQDLNNDLSRKVFIKKEQVEEVQETLNLAQQIAEGMKY